MAVSGEKFYITTTLPYVNSDPHIGFALEIIQADVVARHKAAMGRDVFFNTGTDEHGLKIWQKAAAEGLDAKKFCDKYAARFRKLKEALNLSCNNFIRTTDERHIRAAREFWRICDRRGDIYKKVYKARYCVGCEMAKTDSELEKGRCPLHPDKELDIIEEENYFFRFSKYRRPLLDFYAKNPGFVVPRSRYGEIIRFVEGGLKDFSVSRLKKNLPWGVPVPGDKNQVMFVWFDALVNYISALGWPDDKEKFNAFWPGTQFAGKDNLRQQAAMWQAMLMSAGLPNSARILIHGFINVGGRKMSKSLGNVVDPFGLAARYGADAVRHFLLREIPPTEDGDFTYGKFERRYNADLAAGLGNLFSRVLAMAEKYAGGAVPEFRGDPERHPLAAGAAGGGWEKARKSVDAALENFRFNAALASIWKFMGEADRYIEKARPWDLAREGKTEELNRALYGLLDGLCRIAWRLRPFLPETSLKMAEALRISGLLKESPKYEEAVPAEPGTKIKKIKPLFPKIGSQ